MGRRWINRVTEHIKRFIAPQRFGIVKHSAAKQQDLQSPQDWDEAAEIWDPSEFDPEKENRERRLRPSDYEWDATDDLPWRAHNHLFKGG